MRDPSPAAPAGELDALQNLGKKSRYWLAAVGITSVAQLRTVGAPAAYGLVKYHFGAGPSLNLLCALEGALTNRVLTSSTGPERRCLRKAAGFTLVSKGKASSSSIQ